GMARTRLRRLRAVPQRVESSGPILEPPKKQLFTRWRDDSGSARARKQKFDGAPPIDAKIDRVIVHIQVDVLVHHLFTHLLGVHPDERQAVSAMRERVLDASPQHTVHSSLH